MVCAQVCNNLALAGEMAAVSEALSLGARLGLDPALLSGVFNASSARCWSSDSYNPAPARLTAQNVIACTTLLPGPHTRLLVFTASLAPYWRFDSSTGGVFQN